MSFTETTTQSFVSRVASSFKGILVGGILILVSLVLLFWNEGRTFKRFKDLFEARSLVVDIDSNQVLDENDGQLVHLSGKAESSDVLSDNDFDVSVNAIKLARSVEMLQWQEQSSSETENEFGKTTTVTKYTYDKVWSSSVIDSSTFKESGHDNPGSMLYESQEQYASDVTLGAFQLTPSLIELIGPEVDYKISPSPTSDADPTQPDDESQPSELLPDDDPSSTFYMYKNIPVRLVSWQDTDAPNISITNDNRGGDLAVPVSPQESVSVNNSSVAATCSDSPKIANDGFFIGVDPKKPVIGDLRIRFSVVYPNTEVSVISRQNGNTFVPYQAKYDTVELLEDGQHSAAEMFDHAISSNNLFGWILRATGLVIMFLGFNCILRPLAVLADVFPLLGSIVGMGTGIVSFVFAIILSLTTIAIAWLFYRPLVGCLLLAVAGILLFLFLKRKGSTPHETSPA